MLAEKLSLKQITLRFFNSITHTKHLGDTISSNKCQNTKFGLYYHLFP